MSKGITPCRKKSKTRFYSYRTAGKHCYLIMAFFCTKKCGCNSTKNTAFLEKGSGVWGEGKNLFSRPLGGLRKNSPFASLGLGFIITKNSAFFERERGRGGKGKLFFP